MIRSIFILLSLCFYLGSTYAAINPIVNVSVDKGGVSVNFKLRLFDDVVPDTTSNFLNYVNGSTMSGGSYAQTFFHRNAKDFVLQGGGFSFNATIGGFSFDSTTGDYTGGLQKIVTDATIANEPNLLNVRGSVAMAKKPARYVDAGGVPVAIGVCTEEGSDCVLVAGTGPNSATSQWFINLANNDFLDAISSNGGFTVFAEVIQDDMLIIDDITATDTYNLEATTSFNALPLTDYTPAEPVLDNNLIRIVSMNELYKISDDIDFGDVDVGVVVDSTITIKALENETLEIGNINVTQLSTPFSIEQNGCENTTIVADASCEISVRYAPASINTSKGELGVVFTDPVSTFTIKVVASNAPDIFLSRTIGDFGVIVPFNPTNGLPEQIAIFIDNDGVKDLVLESSEIVFTKGDGSQFQIVDNCQNRTLPPKSAETSSGCAIPVNFIGSTFGEFSFTLTVVSNDPDQPRIDVPFTATVVSDTDGVSILIEDGSPNNGDGNFDGELDSLQSDVVSIPNSQGEYITLVTSNTVQFSNVVLDAITKFSVPFPAAGIEDSVISFEIDDISVGAVVNVGLIIPEGFVYDDFKLLNLNTSTLKNEWVSSEFAGTGGVASIGKTQFTSSNGVQASRDLVIITFVEGGYGDVDTSANGELSVTGLLLIKPDSSGNSGSSGNLKLLFIIILICLIALFRTINKNSIKDDEFELRD